jgi:hypothetical protein
MQSEDKQFYASPPATLVFVWDWNVETLEAAV